jgi:hypothetical protein
MLHAPASPHQREPLKYLEPLQAQSMSKCGRWHAATVNLSPPTCSFCLGCWWIISAAITMTMAIPGDGGVDSGARPVRSGGRPDLCLPMTTVAPLFTVEDIRRKQNLPSKFLWRELKKLGEKQTSSWATELFMAAPTLRSWAPRAGLRHTTG